MKYIRTKDKVLEFIPFSGGKDGEVCDYKNKHKVYRIGFLEILKQADTIEELCDDFVLYENSHYCIIGDIEAKEMATTNYGIIYGAIWTKWGLKYVAKFNDKGELELL